jgi:hypothetical protein
MIRFSAHEHGCFLRAREASDNGTKHNMNAAVGEAIYSFVLFLSYYHYTVGTINAIGNDKYGPAELVDGVTGVEDDLSRSSTPIYKSCITSRRRQRLLP